MYVFETVTRLPGSGRQIVPSRWCTGRRRNSQKPFLPLRVYNVTLIATTFSLWRGGIRTSLGQCNVDDLVGPSGSHLEMNTLHDRQPWKCVQRVNVSVAGVEPFHLAHAAASIVWALVLRVGWSCSSQGVRQQYSVRHIE